MADVTLGAQLPQLVLARASDRDSQPPPDERQRRTRKRYRQATEALVPDGQEGRYTVDVELDGDEVVQITVRERESGTIVSQLSGDELERRAHRPGVILERSA